MKTRVLTGIEYCSLIAGVSIVDLQNVLSLILVIISILVGIANLIMVIIKAVRNDGKIDRDEAQTIVAEINDLSEKLNDLNKKD